MGALDSSPVRLRGVAEPRKTCPSPTLVTMLHLATANQMVRAAVRVDPKNGFVSLLTKGRSRSWKVMMKET